MADRRKTPLRMLLTDIFLGSLLFLSACSPATQSADRNSSSSTGLPQITLTADEKSVVEKGQTETKQGEPEQASDAPHDTDRPAAAARDWPKFLGPTGDSKSTETGILTEWKQGVPRVVWQLPLGTGYSMCTISRGKLFQFDRFDDQTRLTCLDARTGREIWRFEQPTAYEDLYGYNNGPRCSPIVDDDRVYTYGVDGRLACLQVADGKRLWEVDTAREFGVVQNFFGVGSTPVIFQDLLWVMVGGSPPQSQEVPPGQLDRVLPNGSAVVAFDKLTGQVKHRVGDDLASYSSLKLANIGERPYGFAFCRDKLLAWDPRTGKLDFEFPWRARILESVNASTPVVVDDQVLISETYGPGSALLKIAPGKEPQVVWQDDPRRREKAMQTHWNTPVYHEGYLYGCSGRHTENAELRCIEWQTGKVRWSEPSLTRTSLLYVDGHFVCLGEYGNLCLFRANPDKFDLVAEASLNERPEAAADQNAPALAARPLLTYPCWSAPILCNGLLYVRGDENLICLELIPAK